MIWNGENNSLTIQISIEVKKKSYKNLRTDYYSKIEQIILEIIR